MVAELVVSVLKGSPDILTRYFKETQFSFSPRIAKAWQDNITLLKKVSETMSFGCFMSCGAVLSFHVVRGKMYLLIMLCIRLH